jgi:hypothetical protein
MMEPLRGTVNHVGEVLARSESAAELLDHLASARDT